jgi:hypothetical protein
LIELPHRFFEYFLVSGRRVADEEEQREKTPMDQLLIECVLTFDRFRSSTATWLHRLSFFGSFFFV